MNTFMPRLKTTVLMAAAFCIGFGLTSILLAGDLDTRDLASVGSRLPAAISIPLSLESDDLPTIVEQELRRGAHRPGDRELERARRQVADELDASLEQLNSRPLGRWAVRTFHLEKLECEIARSSADRDTLSEIAARFDTHRAKCEEFALTSLHRSLVHFTTLLEIAGDNGFDERFDEQLNKLSTAWSNFERSHDETHFAEVRDAYAWLARYEQASPVRNWLATHTSYPNVKIEVSAPFCNALIPHRLEHAFAIETENEGTQLRGDGSLSGALRASFEPDENRGVVVLRFIGDGTANVTGQRGAAAVDAETQLDFTIQQRLEIDRDIYLAETPDIDIHVASAPVAARVQANPLFRQIGSRTAMTVASRKRKTTEKGAEEQFRKMLVQHLDERRQTLAAAKRVAGRWLDELLERGGLEPTLHAHTTDDALVVESHLVNSLQLGAARAPAQDELPAGSLRLSVHESAINNGSPLLAGVRVGEQDFRAMLFETFSLTPDDNKSERGSGLASFLTLAADPLSVHFDDDVARLTLRIERFTAEGKPELAGLWTVTTSYRARLVEAGIELRRVGGIEVASDDSAGTKELQSILPRFLVSHASSDGITPVGEILRSLDLRIAELALDSGWMTIVVGQQESE
jgi:hypothetical protein